MILESKRNIFDSILSYANFFVKAVYSLYFLIILSTLESELTKNFLLLLFSAVNLSQIFHFGMQRTSVRFLGFLDSNLKNNEKGFKSEYNPEVLTIESSYVRALFSINLFYRIYSLLIFLLFFLSLKILFVDFDQIFEDTAKNNYLFLIISFGILARYAFFGSFVANESLGLIRYNYITSIISFLFAIVLSAYSIKDNFNLFFFCVFFFSYNGFCGLLSHIIFKLFSENKITKIKEEIKLNINLVKRVIVISLKSGSASSTALIIDNAPNFLISNFIDLRIANAYMIIKNIFSLLEGFSQSMALALNNFFVRLAFNKNKIYFAQNYSLMNFYSLLILIISYFILASIFHFTPFFSYFGYSNFDSYLIASLSIIAFLNRWVSQYSSVTNFFDFVVEHYFALAALINFLVFSVIFINYNNYYVFIAASFSQFFISLLLSKVFIPKVIHLPFIQKKIYQPITLLLVLLSFNALFLSFI